MLDQSAIFGENEIRRVYDEATETCLDLTPSVDAFRYRRYRENWPHLDPP